MAVQLNGRVFVALVLLIAPVVLLLISTDAEYSDLGGAFSPAFFPVTTLWCWTAVALLNLMLEVRQSQATRDVISTERWLQIVGVTIAMGFCVYATTRLGFFISGVGFVLATLLILRVKGILLVPLYSVLVPGVLFVLFNHILGLPLPTSPFSHLF